MMNMFQLQERIKDFSKDQLVREMQQPSGAVPPFMVLSELQRRTRMEQAFQADQAKGQQPTVAQEAINAAGVPQGGLADIARAMAPQTDMVGNTGAAPVQQMQEGGIVEGPNTARLRQLMGLYRGIGDVRRDLEVQAARDARRLSTLADIEPRVIPVMDEFSGLPPEMTEPGTLADLPALVDIEREIAPQELPPAPLAAAPLSNTEILRETLRRNDRPMATMRDELDPRFYPMAPEALPPMQGPSAPRVSGAAEGLTEDALAAIAGVPSAVLEPMQGPSLPPPPADPSGLGLPEYMFSQRGTVPEPQPGEGIMPSDIGRAIGEGIGLGPAMGAARTTRIARDVTPLPMDTGTPLAAPEETDGGIEALLPPVTLPTTPQTGGGTGGAGGRGGAMSSDRMLEQDKWLALAQFGLGLMSSQAPTLGGAIGEAGTAALGQLGQARQAAVERDLAERTLAARTAGAGRSRGPSFSNLLTYANSRITAANAALEALAMENITDKESAMDAGRGDAYDQAVRDLQEGNELLRSLGPTMAGIGSLSDVDIDLTQ